MSTTDVTGLYDELLAEAQRVADSTLVTPPMSAEEVLFAGLREHLEERRAAGTFDLAEEIFDHARARGLGPDDEDYAKAQRLAVCVVAQKGTGKGKGTISDDELDDATEADTDSQIVRVRSNDPEQKLEEAKGQYQIAIAQLKSAEYQHWKAIEEKLAEAKEQHARATELLKLAEYQHWKAAGQKLAEAKEQHSDATQLLHRADREYQHQKTWQTYKRPRSDDPDSDAEVYPDSDIYNIVANNMLLRRKRK